MKCLYNLPGGIDQKEEFKRTICEWYHSFVLHRPILLTLTFNTYVKNGFEFEKTKLRMRKNHKHFFNELHRQVFKTSNAKIPRYVVIERGGHTRGFHSHIVIETPKHLSISNFERLTRASWNKPKDSVSLHFEEAYNKQGLDDYLVKQQFLQMNIAEIDFDNSVMNKSNSISNETIEGRMKQLRLRNNELLNHQTVRASYL